MKQHCNFHGATEIVQQVTNISKHMSQDILTPHLAEAGQWVQTTRGSSSLTLLISWVESELFLILG